MSLHLNILVEQTGFHVFFQTCRCLFLQMVLMEESKDKPALVMDREPEGLSNVVEGSHILEASHIREVSSVYSDLTPQPESL